MRECWHEGVLARESAGAKECWHERVLARESADRKECWHGRVLASSWKTKTPPKGEHGWHGVCQVLSVANRHQSLESNPAFGSPDFRRFVPRLPFDPNPNDVGRRCPGPEHARLCISVDVKQLPALGARSRALPIPKIRQNLLVAG